MRGEYMGIIEIDYQNYDRAFKEAFSTFKEKVPPFIDLNLPEIDRFLETEFTDIETKENRIDLNFLLKDGSILHIEEEIHLSIDDVIRFAEYDLKLYNRYRTTIVTVVFCVNKVNKNNTSIEAGSFKYKVHSIDFSNEDAEAKLRELKNKLEVGIEINELELVFLPLMKSNLEKVNLVREVVKVEMQLNIDQTVKEKLVAITLVMADKLIRRDELEKIWEEIRMFKFIEFAEGKGIEKGIEKGKFDVASNMLVDGESEEKVKKYTGLSDEQIEKIKEYIKSMGTH
jgi:hypothetical protein